MTNPKYNPNPDSKTDPNYRVALDVLERAKVDIRPRGVGAIGVVERFDVAGCSVGIVRRVLPYPDHLAGRGVHRENRITGIGGRVRVVLSRTEKQPVALGVIAWGGPHRRAAGTIFLHE